MVRLKADTTGNLLVASGFSRTSREQNNLKVADVSAGRTGLDEIAKRREKFVRVVAIEKSVGQELHGACPFERRAVDDGAGCVRGPIDAVAADTGHRRRDSKRGQRRRAC